MPSSSMLLTGASGYVGGLLLPSLEARGHKVRCLVRRVDRLRGRVGPSTEVIQGDSLDAASLARALAGVDVAFYLTNRSPWARRVNRLRGLKAWQESRTSTGDRREPPPHFADKTK